MIRPPNGDWQAAIQVARGLLPADLVLQNLQLVNVLTGEIYPSEIAVWKGRVVGVGEGYHAHETVDLAGMYVAPGLIDGHIHIESSMLPPHEFARAVLPHGTTCVVSDPHEIANVLGHVGVRFMLAASEGIPFDAYFVAPSCVPSTPLEDSGAILEASDLEGMWAHDRVIGLAEVMNFPGVLNQVPDLLAKIDAARRWGGAIDGHCPGLLGRDLNAYIGAGMESDHEAVLLEEGLEKLRKGLHLMIREGSAARNLDALLPLVTPQNLARTMMITDDLEPHDLFRDGHLDRLCRKAVAKGLDPVSAIRMVSHHTATYFGLKDRGAIAPGYLADLVVFRDLKHFQVERVYKNGQLVAKMGQLAVSIPEYRDPTVMDTVNLDPVTEEAFQLPLLTGHLRVIDIVPGQLITHCGEARVPAGSFQPDVGEDLLKIAVFERHSRTGHHAVAVVRGLGLKRGAIATSIGHDSHNLLVIGTNDRDMTAAINHLIGIKGGLVLVDDGEVVADLALPIAGLMSDRPITEVAPRLDRLIAESQARGVCLENPFMTMAFLALPVIPSLKLSNRGLVDVDAFAFTTVDRGR